MTTRTYKGSCHCGRVAFEVEADVSSALACNCSICRRKGSLLAFVPRERLKFVTPEEDARTYTFNEHVIEHRFCAVCGIHPYGLGVDREGNAMAAINVRCLDDVDLDAVAVQHFDGAAL